MIRNKDILKSLPMLASVLGDQYGVKVRIGGSDAKTDGRTIFIPALPLDCDSETLAMVRGFLDHEAAHIRHTDFHAIKKANMDNITFNLFNSIEDWRIERKLGELYPGCKQNLRWLIRRMFVEKEITERAGDKNPALSVLNYVLLTVRSWEAPELAKRVGKLKSDIEAIFPGLISKIDAIMDSARLHCLSTQGAISYAFQLANCVKKAQQAIINKLDKSGEENKTGQNGAGDESKNKQTTETRGKEASKRKDEGKHNEQSGSENISEDVSDKSSLTISDSKSENAEAPSLSQAENLPQGLGELLGAELSSLAEEDSQQSFQMAIPVNRTCRELDKEDIKEAMSASIALRSRLSGMLQSHVQKHNWIGRHGRLDSRSLYRLRVGNSKVFRKDSPQKGFNTAVHILLDASGSMSGEPIRLALQACYAIAKTLENQRGISRAITAFPAYVPDGAGVYPLVRYGQKTTRRMKISATGNTPLGASLYWTMTELYRRKEERKIMIILTDGHPTDYQLTKTALKEADNLGMEVYGLGLLCNSITDLLPDRSRVISSIKDLTPALFEMLGKTLLKCQEG